MVGACKKTDDRMNGTDMPYSYKVQKYTPAPKGYEPFYINYIGRHGSRYPVAPRFVESVRDRLQDAEATDQITLKGKELITELDQIYKESKGKWGLLTEKGVAQLGGIGERLKSNYPEVWGEHIYAQSDPEERCVRSMKTLLSKLTENTDTTIVTEEILENGNPVLDFFKLNRAYLDFKTNGPWKSIYKSFGDSLVSNDRALGELFMPSYVDTMTQKVEFLSNLYTVYAILPNTDIRVNLGDYFTGDELYRLWQLQNVRQYMEKGPSGLASNLPVAIAFPLLEDFLITSYNSIVDGGVSADFRFAHAETIIPFAALLGIEEASFQTQNPFDVSEHWKDFVVSPMAANIMWVFYSNDQGNILVKMLLNEKEVAFPLDTDTPPYYSWEVVQNYYQSILESLPVIPSLSIEQQVKFFKID